MTNPEALSAAPPPTASILQHNGERLRPLVTAWATAARDGELQPGSLGSSPAAVVLRTVHELGHDAKYDVFTNLDGSQHEYAYTWWTYVREHGLAGREARKPHGYQATLPAFLLQLPLTVATLFELDETFDAAYSYADQDEASVENLLFPERTRQRLLLVLEKLVSLLPITQGDYDTFRHELESACR